MIGGVKVGTDIRACFDNYCKTGKTVLLIVYYIEGSNPNTFFQLYFLKLYIFCFAAIGLSCMHRLVRFMQHFGIKISNHEQPNEKLHSLKHRIETCHEVIIF